MDVFNYDNPVIDGARDYFQRYEFSKRIASLIDKSQSGKSLVVGIYGKWGDGKTSVLNFISSNIDCNTIKINFNPWYLQDDRTLIKAFFQSVASSMGKRLENGGKILKALEDYSDSLGTLSSLVLPYGKAIFGIGKTFATNWKKKDSIEWYKQRVVNLINESKSNFVIFIDDIDRLNIEEIQSVFKLVKLVGDFPRFSYVLALDYDHVATSLSHKFGDKKPKSGYEYLEKIIQIPLHLPKPSSFALREYSLNLLIDSLGKVGVQLKNFEVENFLGQFDLAFAPALKNPRIGIRMANAIAFSVPLLLGEVNLSDLMIIECMRVFYPELYGLIRNNPQLFLHNYGVEYRLSSMTSSDIKGTAEKVIDRELAKYDDQLKEDIRTMLIHLFPQLEWIYHNIRYVDGHHENWFTQKRICSVYYFERYFSYVVKKGDISDVYFNELFANLGSIKPKDFSKKLVKELGKWNVNDFIYKLRYAHKQFNNEEKANLYVALSLIGESLPNVKGVSIINPKDEVARIIRSLILALPKEQKFEACKKSVSMAEPFSYALSLYDKFAIKSQRPDEESFLSDEEIKQIAGLIVDKFLLISKGIRVLMELPDEELSSIFRIANEAGRVEDIKRDVFDVNSLIDYFTAIKIIKVFTPTIHSTVKPDAYKGVFTEDGYGFMSNFVDPSTLYKVLTDARGDMKRKLLPSYDQDAELNDDELVGLFQRIFEGKPQLSD